MAQAKQSDQEQQLVSAMAEFVHNPLAFVYFAFPWGSGILKDETGPDDWQADILRDIGSGSLTVQEALQIAVRSGHGIGKTALIAWLILWFMSTRPHPQIVVTANTTIQLNTKTWRELAKWHKQAINQHWFKWTATKFYHVSHPETWFAVAVPWSKERSEAFAGTHEQHVLVIYDEASAIDDVIWEVTEGVMSTTGAIWIAFGNPTRNTGRFSECFGKYRHRWITREIDSRTAKKANKAQIQQWIDDYGEDSDFVRVRVRGMEPRAGSLQFISSEVVANAMSRVILDHEVLYAPVVMGCDVARFGDDQCIITVRQGLKMHYQKTYRGIDTMQYASYIIEEMGRCHADIVFVDEGGLGAGVIDRLRQLGYRNVIGVNFGSSATKKQYANKRAEMWGEMRDWLELASIIDDNELRDDLTGPEYGFNAREQYQLERKEDMKSRGLASPDKGDSLALTFAHPVKPRPDSKSLVAAGLASHDGSGIDYSDFWGEG